MIRGLGVKAKRYTLQAINKVAGRRLDYWISKKNNEGLTNHSSGRLRTAADFSR